MTRPLDVIIIGAGPYGLAASAHLREAGANVRVLGSPMSFWIRQMPKGMFLRSPYDASHIGDPSGMLALDAFERAQGRRLERPIPLSDFIAYGRWFQERGAPDVDPRHVALVDLDAEGSGFNVTVEDGERIESRRIVVAAGISAFASRPATFDDISPELATHSSEHDDLSRFAGRRVAVIGGGQSAMESAALLHECGADVEVITRAPSMHWVGRAPRGGLIGRLLFDRTDVGPAFISHLVAHPMLLRRLPPAIQRESTRRALAPGASLWLGPRLNDVKISFRTRVIAATRRDGQCELRLDDATARTFDHVILATGYRVDLRRYSFLSPTLLARVRCVSGLPVLGDGLESSVRGLHFLGAPAMHSFGPLLRFVAGTTFAARELARGVKDMRRGATDVADRGAEVRHAAHEAR